MLTHFDWIGAIGSSPVMLVLIGCSVLTLGVVLERVHYFHKRRGNPDDTLAQALKKLHAGQVREAAWACHSSSHPMGAVATQVFEHQAASKQEIEEKMQITLSEQKLLLERNLGFLGTMAAVAPLVGLLGTVWGIMRAFHDMAQTGSAAPAVVAAGVAEALVTTAAGLVIAVPAVMLYNHFTRQMNVMLTVAENHARALRSSLAHGALGDVDASTPPSQPPAGADVTPEKSHKAKLQTPSPATSRVI
jgi:biopolymer transport protein ExbB